LLFRDKNPSCKKSLKKVLRISQRKQFVRPTLEFLESRITPYVLSGYTWANPNVSVSYMPDGTVIQVGHPSNLFAVYNAAYPQATWQREVAMSLQAWADVSNLNFHFVSDDGSPQGTAGLVQGDPRFGDIRLGGYNYGAGGILGEGWNPISTTTGGDADLNTYLTLAIGSSPDLTSVLMHEFGHAIGFNHSLVDPAVMEGGLWGVYPGPYADDIAGVQAMYGARKPDAYEGAMGNGTLATAAPLTLSSGGVTITADITNMGEVDYFKVTAPSNTDGTLTVMVDASTISLLNPKVSVYNSSGTLLGTASASTYQGTATVKLTGLVAGQTYYLQAAGATTDVFGMGAYKLNIQFGGITVPAGPGPDRFEPNDTFATATQFGTLTSLSQTNLTLHTSTDVDYYTFKAGSKGTYTVSITPASGSGTLALTVYNAQQTALATGQSSSGGDSLSVTLTVGQQVYIKVWSPTGSLFTYNLSVGKSGGGATGASGKHLVLLNTEKGDPFYQNAADDQDNPNYVSSSSVTISPSSEARLPTGTNLGVLLPTAAQPSLPGVIFNLGQQDPGVLAVAPTSLAGVSPGAKQSLSTPMVPSLRPHDPTVESGDGASGLGNEEPDEKSADRQATVADPASSPAEPAPRGQLDVLSPPQAGDAWLTYDLWRADTTELGLPASGISPEDSGPTPDPAAAVAALAVLLAGYESSLRAQPGDHKRRHSPM
jgi:hypothetical protein